MLKRGRLVLLNEEMTNPGGAVSGDQSQREEPPPADSNEVYDASDGDRSSNQMEQTRARITVLSHVVGPELIE